MFWLILNLYASIISAWFLKSVSVKTLVSSTGLYTSCNSLVWWGITDLNSPRVLKSILFNSGFLSNGAEIESSPLPFWIR